MRGVGRNEELAVWRGRDLKRLEGREDVEVCVSGSVWRWGPTGAVISRVPNGNLSGRVLGVSDRVLVGTCVC